MERIRGAVVGFATQSFRDVTREGLPASLPAECLAMQCKEVELVLEQEGIAPLPVVARSHLASCNACQSLVADLRDIVAAAHELPAELEPPALVWVSLRAQLENEGIIRTPAAAGAERVSWWHGFSELFRGRALATASVGLLIVADAVLQIQQPAVQLTDTPNPFEETARALAEQEQAIRSWIPPCGRISRQSMILSRTVNGVYRPSRRTSWRANIFPGRTSKKRNCCPR